MRIEILTLSKDMVGDLAEVRAEILEDTGSYWRVKDIIRISVQGGSRMTDKQLRTHVEGVYSEGA